MNINSLKNKFELLNEMVRDNVNLLIISKKMSIPHSQTLNFT